jgi:hypothetical protein
MHVHSSRCPGRFLRARPQQQVSREVPSCTSTAAGVPGGSFVHVYQAMVNVVGIDLRNAQITFRTGIEAFSGAVSGNMELKKQLTQNILLDVIFNA